MFPLSHALSAVFGPPEESGAHVLAPLTLGVLVIGAMVVGVLLAYLFVGRRPVPVTRPVQVSLGHPRGPQRPVRRHRQRVAVHAPRPVAHPGTGLRRQPRRRRCGQRLAATLGGSSARLGRLQTGFVRSYALGMLGGAVIVAGALLAVTAG